MNNLDVLGFPSKLSLLVLDQNLHQSHLASQHWSPEFDHREEVETSTRAVDAAPSTIVEKPFEGVSEGVNQDLPKYLLEQSLARPS